MDRLKQNNTKLCKTIVSVAKECADVCPDGGRFKVTTSGRGQALCVLNGQILSLDEIWKNAMITGFDRSVMDAIYTIWTGRKNKDNLVCDISYLDIYRRIRGGDVKISAEIRRKVEESVRKMRYLDMTLVIANDADKVKTYFGVDKDIQRMRIRGHLINADEIAIEAQNGLCTSGIRLYSCPIMYQYAEALGQIISTDQAWLAIPGRLTDRKIAVRDYLISYIKAKAYEKNKIVNDNVSYKAILEGSGIEWPEDQKLQYKCKLLVKEILDYYEKSDIIKTYIVSKDKTQLEIVVK